MNVEETKAAIEVMEAFCRGEDIQANTGPCGAWATYNSNRDTLCWDWATIKYRIKPKPREFWINEYETGGIYIHRTQASAESCRDPRDIPSPPKVKTFKVIEVLE